MTSSTPPTGPGPEYLEQGGGGRLPRERGSRGTGRRTAVIGGATVVGLAVVGTAVWAAASFFATGAQPAEALPAATLGYASIDLDPSGGQKIEAVQMLNKFPAFKAEIGLNADDDMKQLVFDKAELSDACEGLDYDSDIEPWLGDRAAVAAVDLGKDQPVPVGVLQVTDADAASDGLARLRDCGNGEDGGWTIEGEWAVVAETQELAREVVAAAGRSTLVDDATYQKWMDDVGDPGVLNLYASPEAGDYLADHLDELGFPFGPMEGGAGMAESSGGSAAYRSELEMHDRPQLPDEMVETLRDFGGLAATLRFDDGALELESVGDAAAAQQGYYATEAGDDVLASLPTDTAAAFGVGFADGWAQQMLDEVTRSLGGGQEAEGMVRQAEQWTGLELPEDLETLFGDSTVLSLGADFDPETFVNSEDGSDVPVGIKVKGDPAEVERVLDKLRGRIGESDSGLLGSNAEGDVVAIGPNGDYLERIVGDGDLGDSETFRDVVREAERAGVILFVNFDAGDGWLTSLAEGDPEAEENLEPLGALGVSSWQDGDTAHGMVRLTTN